MSWVEKSRSDKNIRFADVFGIPGKRMRDYNSGRRSRRGRRGRSGASSLLQTLTSVYDNEFAGEIEDEFDCSGMCRPALFYFTRPLSDGMP